jgi:hypothetical protein
MVTQENEKLQALHRIAVGSSKPNSAPVGPSVPTSSPCNPGQVPALLQIDGGWWRSSKQEIVCVSGTGFSLLPREVVLVVDDAVGKGLRPIYCLGIWEGWSAPRLRL